MKNTVNRLKQFLLRTKEYKDLFFNSSDRDKYFYSTDAENRREDLIKRYEELKDLIIEANSGIPTTSFFGYDNIDIFGNSYSSSNSTSAFHCLKLAPEIIIKSISFWGGKKVKIEQKELIKNGNYINNEIVDLFSKKEGPFNYKKLISLISELNNNYNAKSQYSTATLIRAILDHIPPLLGKNNFDGVVNNYPWGKTDKNYINKLSSFRDIADDSLHRQIEANNDLVEMDQIPESICLRRLLQECAVKGGNDEFDKIKEIKKTDISIPQKINITLVEDKNDWWQNYAVGFYTGYGLKFVLNVDNFNSSKPDYLTISLKAKDSLDKQWASSHFIFDIEKTEQDNPFKINPFEEKKVVVVVSDQEFSHTPTPHRFKPDLDRDTLILWVYTKSGKTFQFPIKGY